MRPDRRIWRWKHLGICPSVFSDADAIERYWQDLNRDLDAAVGEDFRMDWRSVPYDGFLASFNLAHLNRCCRAVKEKLAGLFHQAFPHQTPAICAGAGRSRRARIGFLVTAGHENGFLRGTAKIVEQLDAARFEPIVFCARRGVDLVRQTVRRPALAVVSLPPRFDWAVEWIRQATCDVLYYWKVGADPWNQFLPMAKLAPIQCTSWGTHGTSGVGAVDYYLSSPLMETDVPGVEVGTHYTERLAMLPTFPTFQERQARRPPCTRGDFGLPDRGAIYLCPHRLPKYHPDFDVYLREILDQDPSGHVVLLCGHPSDGQTLLGQRIRRNLGDSLCRRVFLRSAVPVDQYYQLLSLATVVLDSFVYAGGITAYDAFSYGVPVVTQPGTLAVQNCTAGLYRRMGISELVAKGRREYGAQSIFSDVVCASAGVASAGGLGGENSSSAPGEPGALNASSGDSPSARTPAGMSVTIGDDVPQNGAAPDGADNWAADQLALLSADSSHSKNGGPVVSTSCCCGCGCGNTAPYLANTGPGHPAPPSEVYLNAAPGDTNEIILPDYFRDDQQAPETLGYSTQPPAGNCVTTEIVMVGGDATLRFHSTGNTGSTTVTARATDNGGLFYDWSFTVYACRVTGYQVQERAWGQNTWSAPEDGGADWKLLWTHNQYRWKPIVSTEATGHVTSHSWDFTSATWCKGVCNYGDWDPWAYGNPTASGLFTVTPGVNFGSVIDTYYTRSASASLVAAPQPNADQPRLSMHQISSLAWQTVAYSQTFVDPDDSTSHNLAELQEQDPYWKAFPDYGTPNMNEVRATLTVGPAIPTGMQATVYVTWYDPLNVLANVTTPPPAGAPAHTLRDNVTSMTPAGAVLTYPAGKQAKNVYFAINNARLGDNFILAAHPNNGIENTYTFGAGCGCGPGEVLHYEDYPLLSPPTGRIRTSRISTPRR